MAWRVAKSLLTLRDQVNKAAPERNKGADGTIGDAAHASRSSDHNPHVKDGAMGIVTAMDITHDPAGGVNSYKLAETLRQQKDPRVKYVISNKRIFSSETMPWQWRSYSGSNPHSQHVHISVKSQKAFYDDTSPWKLEAMAAEPDAPPIVSRPLLKRGSKGDEVARLQTLLKVEVDGKFGSLTERAVKSFQSLNDLVADGIVGPYTWQVLEKKD